MNKKGIVLVYSHGAGQNVRVDRMPRVGETMKAISWHLDRDGGKGTNIAVALGRLGVPVTLIAKVGTDMWADLCTGWLTEAGVDTSFIRKDPSVSTSTGVVFIDQQGNNSIVLSNSDTSISHELIEEGLENNKDCRICITGFEIPEENALFALEKAKHLGMMTIINPSPVPENHKPDLENADIVIVNEIEMYQLLNLVCEKNCKDDLIVMTEKLRKKYGLKKLILTLGANGYILNENGNIYKEKGIQTKPVDTSGAGDGFLAAAAYRLYLGDSLKEACEWANVYAAVTVKYSGTIPGYRPLEEIGEEIDEILNGMKRDYL